MCKQRHDQAAWPHYVAGKHPKRHECLKCVNQACLTRFLVLQAKEAERAERKRAREAGEGGDASGSDDERREKKRKHKKDKKR